MKKKIAFVVQRYGKEVNGGAELYCRMIAEKLKSQYDIEIITTCAIDYVTWENHYKPGVETINDITVRRFEVDKLRSQRHFDKISEKVYFDLNHNREDEIEWMKSQGPASTKLISYLRENKDNYDKFIFITYLYYTTFFGIQEVYDKSILIPTAHDEPPIYLKIFDEIFNLPKAFVYLTEEEKEFVNKKFNNDRIPSVICGVGVDVPSEVTGNKFKEKFNINDKFILYVGRIDESKGCKELFDYFLKYKKENRNNVKLVLMGKSVIDIPKCDDIIPLGFVSDEDKFNGIAAAELCVLPSKFESLSISILESLALGVPILVNGECEVLKGHCVKSNAGLYYRNYYEFEECLKLIIYDSILTDKMGDNGQNYINKNYKWEVIKLKFTKLIDSTKYQCI